MGRLDAAAARGDACGMRSSSSVVACGSRQHLFPPLAVPLGATHPAGHLPVTCPCACPAWRRRWVSAPR